MDIEKLKKEFPNVKLKELNASTGANLYLPGKLVITIFFKRKLFKTNEVKKFRRFADDEDILKIICALGNIKLKSIAGTAAANPEAEQGNNGTKQCIDHIKRKLAIAEKNNPDDNRGIFILRMLIQELQQYL